MANGPDSPFQEDLAECYPVTSTPSPPMLLNLPRRTEQSLALITVDGTTYPFLAIKNYILKKIHLIETSGCSLLGMGGDGEAHYRGCKHTPSNIIALSCLNSQYAWRIFESLRLRYEFPQDIEYFIVDLCNCTASPSDCPFMEICLYEVRDIPRFNDQYIKELPKVVSDHNGHLIAATQKISQMMGAMTSNYCTISQWSSCAEYRAYVERASKIFNESQSGCVRRAFADLGHLHPQGCRRCDNAPTKK